MVKALTFKGDKKKKRKRAAPEVDDGDDADRKALVATEQSKAATEDDDSWVNVDVPSDVTGPIMIVLPTEPPSCLACDANGKVFTLPVENLIDDDPATAEPHDVRQVWVANRVAGTESVSLKGSHGHYLSCDNLGTLSARATAISPSESLLCTPVPNNPSTFSLQTARDTFLTLDDSKPSTPIVRGDAETISYKTTFRLRMQARYKPKLKASKEEKAKEKISRKELEQIVGRRLEDGEVRKLKKARREGNFHEAALDIKVKSSHDKFAS